MRRLVTSAVILLLAVTMTGCSSLGVNKETRIKCPACGYEFVAGN